MTNTDHASGRTDDRDRQVVLVLRDAETTTGQGEIQLASLLEKLWQKRWFVAVTTVVFIALAIAYALTATPYYRAETALLQRDSKSSLSSALSQFGGLADLAGISAGGEASQEPLAVLRSRGFAERFITRNELAGTLSEKDGMFGATSETDAQGKPDLRLVVERFMRHVMTIQEDKKSGLVKIAIEWKDPAVAAQWANGLAAQLNQELQARAIEDSARNIKYLRGQLESTSTVALQESIARLLESELQKAMLAGQSEDYAFRVIDPAEPPVLRSRPQRTAIVLLAAAVGLFLSMGAALLLGAAGSSRRRVSGA